MLGDLNKKREIFSALGQNYKVKDKKVTITNNEWFVPIEKAYPALEAEYKRIELDKNLTTAMRNELFAQLILVWGRLLDKFRTVNWLEIDRQLNYFSMLKQFQTKMV